MAGDPIVVLFFFPGRLTIKKKHRIFALTDYLVGLLNGPPTQLLYCQCRQLSYLDLAQHLDNN